MTWKSDHPLDLPKITRIIQTHFPQFTNIQPLGQGWDNIAVLAHQSKNQTVFRLPHRAIASQIIQNEIAALPALQPLLPIPIPQITHVGMPTPDYPYPFIGYPHLPGQTADSLPWTDQQRSTIVTPLARFLKTLHQIPIDQPPFQNLPTNDFFQKDPASMQTKIQERLAQTTHLNLPVPAKTIQTWLNRLLQNLLPTPKTVLVHGDLYPRHILVSPNRQITAIIDWGDLHLNHPAIDLSLAYTFVPPTDRPRFFQEYGLPITPDDQKFAQIRALVYALALTHYGQETNDPNAEKMGRQIFSEHPLNHPENKN